MESSSSMFDNIFGFYPHGLKVLTAKNENQLRGVNSIVVGR